MTINYITKVDFSQKATEDSCGAHIAYTFAEQGGAASGYNKPLLFKSQDGAEITAEKIEALAKLGEDVTELKKAYNSNITSIVGRVVREKFESGWDWIWVYDIDVENGIVIFSSDEGLFKVGFTMDGVNVQIEEVAQPVVTLTDYEVVDEDVMVSVDFIENIAEQSVQAMVKSAFKDKTAIEYLTKAKKASANTNSVIAEEIPAESSANTQKIEKGDKPLEIQELLKSNEAQDLIKSLINEATEGLRSQLEKAEASRQALLKAEEKRVEEEYTTVFKSYGFIEEDKVEALVKHLIEHKDVADTLVQAFEKAQSEIKTTQEELGKEVGADVTNQEPLVKSASELIKNKVAELKKAKQA